MMVQTPAVHAFHKLQGRAPLSSASRGHPYRSREGFLSYGGKLVICLILMEIIFNIMQQSRVLSDFEVVMSLVKVRFRNQGGRRKNWISCKLTQQRSESSSEFSLRIIDGISLVFSGSNRDSTQVQSPPIRASQFRQRLFTHCYIGLGCTQGLDIN